MAEEKKTSRKVKLPLLILKDTVVLPGGLQTITVSREMSSMAVFYSKSYNDSMIFVTTQKKSSVKEPTVEDIYEYGTLCRIMSFLQDKGKFIVRIMANDRYKFTKIEMEEKAFAATGEQIKLDQLSFDDERKYYEDLDKRAIDTKAYDMFKLQENVERNSINNFEALAFTFVNYISIPLEKKLKALMTTSPKELYDLALDAANAISINKDLEEKINADIRESSEQAQKEYFLRERLKAIKTELNGGENGPEDKNETIKKRLEEGQYPENVKKRVENEMKKADMMPPGSLETSLIQNYVDVLMDLPWWQKTKDNNDIKNVEKILDEDHYGLEKVKKRIIEYLAVKQLTGNLKSPILCFFGPPGCGKTSLGRSIARALGRKFFKASLGGISDEAEIRGHRRTYVGSMPGRIINGMKKVGVTNPVFLLDEIDKLGSSYKGDPSSAMLEVLDPEQNVAFNDNYVEEPYDLSDVLFICTANNLENIPAPLRDRLELIEVNSYTLLEKIEIAKRHLVKKELFANGLEDKDVEITDDGLNCIINDYTREAGVRELERKIAACLRKVAVDYVKKDKKEKVVIDAKKVKKFLGTGIIDSTKKEEKPQIGVVTGLAYSEYGGAILQIEVTHFPGKGGLVLTGKLGDVMKESATIAVDYVRANAEKYGIDPKIFMTDDIHIHVPEGAIPKDGPSAGCAITTAIISCLSKKPVKPNVAMTGEVTLRGYALPIGGLREKSLAAVRSGIDTIIVPRMNKVSIEELPKEIKDHLKVIYMDNVDDALKNALAE